MSEINKRDTPPNPAKVIGTTLRDAILIAVGLILFAVFMRDGIGQLTASANVEELATWAMAEIILVLLPFLLVGFIAMRIRAILKTHALLMFLTLIIAVIGLQSIVVGGQYFSQSGAFGTTTSVEATFEQVETGVRVVDVTPGGMAETGGLQVDDVITAIRRDDVDLTALNQAIVRAEEGNILRFRLLRGDEEMQLPIEVTSVPNVNNEAIIQGYIILGIVALIALALPSLSLPYIMLILLLIPLGIGYLWLIVATFSEQTDGLIPVDANGNFGGFTLNNWSFLFDGKVGQRLIIDIAAVTFNSLFIAVIMTVIVLLVASMGGYALSRMKFPGRRSFLALTLILHSFPAVTLLIPIFIVLQNIGKIPLLGSLFGFNTVGGVALVMVAFELPLGVFLMKGFFDGISWDMERSAMIDGATRWRTFFEIIVPQIRPGLLALGVFSFLGGWNAYLVPATFMLGTRTANLPVLINDLTGELQPVNWNQVAAVGLFQLIPILIFFLFAQEYLLNIYAGGTKGSS